MSNPFQPTPPPPPKSPGERRARPRFDTMKIWDEASAALLANREVLLAVLGVFSILPVFALTQFIPLPEPVPGQLPAQLFERWGQYFDDNWLPFLAVMLAQLLGMLVTLALLGDPRRPTVGEAMRQALRASPSFLAALIGGHALAVLSGLVPVILIGLSGSIPLTKVAAVIGSVVILYMLVRFAFIGPAVLLGGERNPVYALRRSFFATKGIGWQMLVFILLIYVAFSIIGWLIQAALVIVTTLVAGAEGGTLIGNLVESAVQAALAATFVAVIAASYRQVLGVAR
ncbi:MAG: hypothetical protein QFC78_04025 [Pseudomonadota bacterium]|nr:hypothetical protein [Pseudomonadota bacterium]